MFNSSEITSYLTKHTGKTGYVINDSQYKEDPGLLTWMWILIQGAFGAKVETFAQRRESCIIKEAQSEFAKLSHALMSGQKGRIAEAVEEYNVYHFTAKNRLDSETLTGRATDVLRAGTKEVKKAVLELANKTDTLADQLFSFVIRRKGSTILDGIEKKQLPDGVILKRFKDDPEKAVHNQEDPVSLAVAYLLRKEGEAGKIYKGLEEIDLQKGFDLFVQKEYDTSALPRLMASAKAKVDELKKLREEYRKNKSEEVLDQMVHLSAQLQGVASELKKAVKEFESFFDAQTKGIASLGNQEATAAWTNALSKHKKEAQDLRREAKSVAMRLRRELKGYEKIIAASERSLLKKLQTTFSGLEKQTSAPQSADDSLLGSVAGYVHWGFVQLGLAEVEAKDRTIGEMITELRKGIHHSMSHLERVDQVLELGGALKGQIDDQIKALKSKKEAIAGWNSEEKEWVVELENAAVARKEKAEKKVSELEKKHGKSKYVLHQQMLLRAKDELKRAEKSVTAAQEKVEIRFKDAVRLAELERASEWVDLVGLEREILFVARRRARALKAGSESLESYSEVLGNV